MRELSFWAKPCAAATMLVVASSLGGSHFLASAEPPGAHPARAAVRASASRAPRATASKATKAVAPIARARSVRARRVPASVVRGDRLDLFRGLGAWIDLYDGDLNPRRTVAQMKGSGVRTLYIQTGRTNTRRWVDPSVRSWLVNAHRAGIKVVGWYLPYYKNLDKDVRRTVAIARYRYRGHRFDGIGIDIEFRGAVRSRNRWNRNVARLGELVRKRVGKRYPVAAIPPTPLQMRVAPEHWAGFPWRRIARSSDAMVLMSYWSDRSGCPKIRRHCAYEFTRLNVRLTRALSGRRILVHVIGGIGDAISGRELTAFIRAARDERADGASIYDVMTTKQRWWRALRSLRALGA
jgi:hypothetical protein